MARICFFSRREERHWISNVRDSGVCVGKHLVDILRHRQIPHTGLAKGDDLRNREAARRKIKRGETCYRPTEGMTKECDGIARIGSEEALEIGEDEGNCELGGTEKATVDGAVVASWMIWRCCYLGRRRGGGVRYVGLWGGREVYDSVGERIGAAERKDYPTFGRCRTKGTRGGC